MKESILDKLQTVCPFPDVLKDVEQKRDFETVPRRKICHIRADYNGWRWWSTFWSCHDDLLSEPVKKEIGQTFDALTAPDALASLSKLSRFCCQHPEARANEAFDDEYNFYLEGEHCDFWLRLITRVGDYNMYLHAFAKDKKKIPSDG